MRRVLNSLLVVTVAMLPLFVNRDGGACTGAESVTTQRAKSKAPTKNKHYVRHRYKSKDSVAIDYWVMSPPKLEEGRKYPLVLALHGRGGNTTAATELGSDALRKKYPCFVMAPASTADGHWARPASFGKRRKKSKSTKAMLPAALEAMEALIKKHPIDANRVYVTGQSMGGVGTFGAMVHRPRAFAAAIPVCGGWNPKDSAKMKDIAIWVFHGDKDQVVPTEYSRKMVEAIKKSGGSPKYTEYKGVAHNSWSQTYASPETWMWLFEQSRGR